MNKKYIFIDLDGTIIDHQTHSVPESTKLAFKMAKENGHEIILATGRPPGIFYGIDKQLGFDSFVAANGRVVVSKGKIIYEQPISEDLVEAVLALAQTYKVDIACESMDGFILETNFDKIYVKFCDHFHLNLPTIQPGYYKNKAIYQMSLFYEKEDFKKFEIIVPELSFEYACPYGIDVNTRGGFKEVGIKEYMKYYNLKQEDIIVIGDGHNDISMFKFADISIAMGNAHMDVQKHAKYVTDRIDEDGLYKAFKKFNII